MNFYKDKRVAVLGGAGMIGSQLVELLVKEEAKVTVVDDFSRGRWCNLVGQECEVLTVDLRNWNALCKIFLWHQWDIVFNMAAKVTGMHYNRLHHSEMFAENMRLQMDPLAVAANSGVPHFLQCSTVCVYPHNMTFPVGEGWGHLGEPEPTNAGYGWAKRMGERYAQWVANEYPIQVAITRFSNCFGPRDYFDSATSHVIPALIRKTLEDDVVRVWGTGNQVREFLYSTDAARGAMKVLEHYPEADPVNIGNPDNRIAIGDLAQLIQEVMGVNKPIEFRPEFPVGYPKRGSDISKLMEVTAWRPQTSLREGLEKTIEWYLENKEIA